MKRIISALFVVGLCACGGKPVDFKHGVPTAQMVNLDMPSTARAGLQEDVGQSQQGLMGDRSEYYGLTRLTTGIVNGASAWILGALKSVTAEPPTSMEGNVAVWGPHTPELSLVTWRLTVTRTHWNQFSYVLEGKGKAEPDTAYKAVLSGAHTAAVDSAGEEIPNCGSGNFLVEWGNARDGSTNAGNAEVTYSRLTPTSDVTINVEFRGVRDAATGLVTTGLYGYKHFSAGGGEFTFSTDANVQWWDGSLAALEHLSIKSRWTQTGAGRADILVTGGDLVGPATINECWDQTFASQYMFRSYAPTNGLGSWGAASSCSFSSADYAK